MDAFEVNRHTVHAQHWHDFCLHKCTKNREQHYVILWGKTKSSTDRLKRAKRCWTAEG